MGNGTCDLDSAISTLIQAFSEYLDGIKNNEKDLAVIPLMNIPEKEYRLKTEVVFFMKRHSISSNLLIFRDQIDLKALKENVEIKLEIVLVDHHNLPNEDMYLMESVIKIIDHRPQDKRWPWTGRKVYLENVGSCATLVARNLFDKHPEVIDSQISSLLRGPILIDTYNLSKKVDRATSMDIEIIEALEKIGSLDLDRDKVFNEIFNAKSDISELTVDDLLIRDLKETSGVPITVLPILVKDFLDLQGSLKSLENFVLSKNITIIIVMGLDLTSEKVFRDIAVFSLATDQLKKKIIEALLSAQPSLELTLIKEINNKDENFNLVLYEQKNVRITRKQILPIIQNTISSECQC